MCANSTIIVLFAHCQGVTFLMTKIIITDNNLSDTETRG